MIRRDATAVAAAVPTAARLLGGAGLLPPLFAILLSRTTAGWPGGAGALLAAIAYAAIILSFLGGMWWGMAASRLGPRAMAPWLATSVLPSLVAWPALLLGVERPATGAALIGVALIATLLGDRQLVAAGLAPAWWMRLRVPLSCGLALLTMTAGWLASR